MRFDDRRDAGVALAARLLELDPKDPVVLALPRGGVPVGFEVAQALGCDLDVLLVRKLGVPWHPELAMGAVGEGGVAVVNMDLLATAGVSEAELRRVAEQEGAELARRTEAYRGGRPMVDPTGKTAVIVDDGLATGASAEAAIAVARACGAGSVWVCVPVAPADTVLRVAKHADKCVVLHQPARFVAVGQWYRDFSQTTDEEVSRLLDEARLR